MLLLKRLVNTRPSLGMRLLLMLNLRTLMLMILTVQRLPLLLKLQDTILMEMDTQLMQERRLTKRLPHVVVLISVPIPIQQLEVHVELPVPEEVTEVVDVEPLATKHSTISKDYIKASKNNAYFLSIII